jgi:hypothetical protein
MSNQTAGRPGTTVTIETLTAANDSTANLVASYQEKVYAAFKELAPLIASALSAPAQTWPPDLDQVRAVVDESFVFPSRVLEANRGLALDFVDAWPWPASGAVVE